METNPNITIIEKAPYDSNTEELIWVQKPDKTGYLLNKLQDFIKTCAIIFLVMAFFYVLSFAADNAAIDWSGILLVAAILLLVELSKFSAVYHSTYAISPTRLVIYKKYSITYIPLTEIVKITVHTTWIDNKRDTGTMAFFCGETEETEDGTVEKQYYFFNIYNPYQVLELIEGLQRGE